MAMRRQRLTSLLLILFLLALAGLTLFSNTLNTAMLPKVTTEKPAKKTLSRFIEGSGTIVPRETAALEGQSGWKIAKVHVGENEQVKKDQVLITFDSTEAQRQLLDEEDRMRKMELNQEALQGEVIAAQRDGSEERIRQAERDLQNGQLDLNIQLRKIEQMRKDLALARTLKAPFDGTVANLEAEEGASAAPGQILLELIKAEAGFQFSFKTDDESASLLRLKEKIIVDVKGEKDRQQEGTIAEIKETPRGSDGGGNSLPGADGEGANSGKTVIVHLSGGNFQGGEEASVHVEKQAEEQGLVIRNERLRKDEKGSYVFVVREEKSSLGNVYTVVKRYVKTGDRNEEETIILDGLWVNDDIIAESGEPLQEGNRIRLD